MWSATKERENTDGHIILTYTSVQHDCTPSQNTIIPFSLLQKKKKTHDTSKFRFCTVQFAHTITGRDYISQLNIYRFPSQFYRLIGLRLSKNIIITVD